MGQAGSTRYCGNCGTPNTTGDQFCENCGYALAGGPTQTVVNTVISAPGATTVRSAATTPTALGATIIPPKAIPPGTPAGRRVTGALAAGELLYGRYRTAQLVGKGGFGAVYKAYDEHFQIQRVVAIKEMSDAQLSPTEKVQAIQAFRQEAELLVPLQHLNLPNVTDFFEEGGKAYLAMEFIEGKTLEDVQEDSPGPLAEKLVMGWALQLCDVLQYLHTQPQAIIFRDLKPPNIMVTKDGRIKLIDFGIARIFKSTAVKDTTSLGSRGYAPLEQYGKGQTDARSDIYALGATLYDLLTKTTPADAATRRVNPSAFEEPRKLNPQLSVAVERIILKAMAEEPKDRFQSAFEMYQAIAAGPQLQAATPVIPAPVPIPSPSPYPVGPVPVPQVPRQPGPSGSPRTSRRRFIIGGAAAVATAAVALAVGSRFLPGTPTPAPTTGTVTLTFSYSTEKDAWIKSAIQAFHNSKAAILAGSNKAIQLELDNSGSLNVGDRILQGSSQLSAWSPASDLELNRLNYKWQKAHNGQDIVGFSSDLAPRSLVSSPLVFATWKDRAGVLLSSYQSIDWPGLYQALSLKNGWADLGHPEWGASIYLGQTLPDQSNSGLLTITLMAYAYAKSIGSSKLSANLVSGTALWKYLKVFEDSVNGFGRSSGTYIRNVVDQGPAAYAITTTYENLVLMFQQDAQAHGKEPLQIFYPGLNAVSNHPFAILQASWVSPEQQKAAMQFRDFLLSREQQLQVLAYGFRPSDPSIQLTDASVSNNPFQHLSQLSPGHTVNQPIQPLAEIPSGDVVEALITQWEKAYPNPQVVTG
jgi:serine/threonine protein kinase/ABC-type Fe3+ transport system substrate-binding protein